MHSLTQRKLTGNEERSTGAILWPRGGEDNMERITAAEGGIGNGQTRAFLPPSSCPRQVRGGGARSHQTERRRRKSLMRACGQVHATRALAIAAEKVKAFKKNLFATWVDSHHEVSLTILRYERTQAQTRINSQARTRRSACACTWDAWRVRVAGRGALCRHTRGLSWSAVTATVTSLALSDQRYNKLWTQSMAE